MSTEITPNVLHLLRPRGRTRGGFTILEMMIAMAITLLMMAALTRAFKVIGDTMQASRANVELSARLRTISFRIGSELQRSTATLQPPRPVSFGEGYFCYYDGPMTDSTTIQSSVVGVYDAQAGTGIRGISRDDSQAALQAYFPLSRYGDFDDYLAFTVAAEEGTSFKGIVPAFVEIFKNRELAIAEASRQGISPPTFPALSDAVALQPVVIESKYAEVIYWVSPARDASGAIIDVIGEADLNGDGIGDGDGIPDTLFLRRRVLLIRPDLNLSDGFLSSFTASDGTVHLQIGTGLRPLATAYQECDLSMRRPVSAEGVPQPTGTGAVSRVIANSIADLTLPENRFAHVRVPEGTAPFTSDLNGVQGVQMTSMPVLDLLSPEGLLALPAVDGLIGGSRKALTGFLNPAYELTGNRVGEDVVLSNIVGFDVRGFDSSAPIFVHVGPDGVPGSIGDDDGDGDADFADPDFSEFGAQGSDDVTITSSDPGFHTLIRQTSTTANTVLDGSGNVVAVLAGRGDFVDLNYVYKAAGNVIAPIGMEGNASALRTNLGRFCDSPLSGFYDGATSGLSTTDGWLIPHSYWKSGKVVLGAPTNNGRSAIINQPTYDTWASDYDRDRHNQGVVAATNLLGTLWVFNYRPFDPTSTLTTPTQTSISTIDPTLATNDPRRLWTNLIDEGSNGIDESGSGPGVDDETEQEAPAPISYALPGIQLRIRVMDQDTQSVRQTVITQDFAN